jgi:hypothetical protein
VHNLVTISIGTNFFSGMHDKKSVLSIRSMLNGIVSRDWGGLLVGLVKENRSILDHFFKILMSSSQIFVKMAPTRVNFSPGFLS